MGQSLMEWNKLPSRRTILAQLEAIEMSADAKAATAKLLDFTFEAGGKLVEVGKAILAFAIELTRRFPNLAFGVLVALLVSYLVGAVPLVGPALSALLAPILLAIGISTGALQDMWNGALRRDVETFGQEMNAETVVGR